MMSRRVSPLWQQWSRTARRCGSQPVVVDAVTRTEWTANALSALVEKFLDEMPPCRGGERMAFRLSGTTGIALFLALQRAGLVAVPFDTGLPKEGCWELAQRLKARAVYWDDAFHLVDDAPLRSRNACCLKLTSGSSAGVPKSFECRAEHLLADGAHIIRGMGLRRSDRHLAAIPLGHSYGLGSLVMPLILQGAPLILAERFVPRQLLEWIDRYRATVFPGVPALFRVLAGMPGEGAPSSLRLAVSAGAPLTAEVARAFFERYRVKLHNFYGSSETGGICYDRSGAASLSGRSVGKPLAGVTVTIRRGKIIVKSPAVVTRSGRWELPDIGEWNAHDELVLLGRAAGDANIGGKKVHPAEVERALRKIPFVHDASVWILRAGGREYLAAAVESSLQQEEIERHLLAHLPEWKMPKRYVVARELPRNARGKLDAAALRAQLES